MSQVKCFGTGYETPLKGRASPGEDKRCVRCELEVWMIHDLFCFLFPATQSELVCQGGYELKVSHKIVSLSDGGLDMLV